MRCENCGSDPCQCGWNSPRWREAAQQYAAERIANLQIERRRRRKPQAAASWEDDLIMPEPKTPRPLAIVENAMVVLANEPELKELFAYDEMLCAEVIMNSPARPLTDVDITTTQCFLQRFGLRRIGHQTTRDAIERYAKTKPFHPLRDYLNGLQWDETVRHDHAAAHYLDAADNAYNNTVFSMFLIAMVARVMRPGCKADHMVILEGPQGTLKSTACSILAHPWYSDALPDLSAGKDVSLHLRGKWLIEIAEMHAFSRAEATHLKAFLARDHERFRPVYGRKDVIEPRQCVFVGTSNKDAYLKDETGGRRFWPIKCGMINIERLRTDRDQLLAEALVAYHDGVPWWPSPEFETEHIRPEQEHRYEGDAWDNLIANYLDNQLFTPTTTTAQIAKEALGLEHARLDMLAQKRIAAVMYRHGWKRAVRNSRRFWEKA
jgi:predicted P-loop ATPase